MLNPGDILENWVIVGKLGEGGMGEVYRARNRVIDDIEAAIKVSRPTDFKQARARFQREVKSLLRLQHPFVVRVQGFGEDQDRGLLWFAMDLVEGQPLEDVLHQGPMRIPDAVALFAALCDGLAHAHDRGVAHRDLKPANVIVKPGAQGGLGGPVLVDFGISAAVDEDRLTRTGMVVGTPQYLPPEALEGKVADPARADTYAIGQMLIEAIDGQAVFDFDPELTSTQNALRIMHRKVAVGPLSPRHPVPASLQALLTRATHPDPNARMAHIGELGQGLREIAATLGGTVPAGQGETTWHPIDRSPSARGGSPTLSPMAPGASTTSGALDTMAVPTGETAAAPTPPLRTPPPRTPPPRTPVPEDPPATRRTGLWIGLGLVAVVLIAGVIGTLAVGGVAVFAMLPGADPTPAAVASAGTTASGTASEANGTASEANGGGPPIVPAEPAGTTEPPESTPARDTHLMQDPPPPPPLPDMTPPEDVDEVDEEDPPPAEPDPVDDEGPAEPPGTTEPEPVVAPPPEAPPTEPEPATTSEPTEEPGTAEPPKAPTVSAFRPDWGRIMGVQKGMSDGKIDDLLGPGSSGSSRYCKGGESGREYAGGAVTVCRGLIGGARRIHITQAAVGKVPSDRLVKLLGKDKEVVKATIGDPDSDSGGVLRYAYGRALLYLSGDTVSAMVVEL